ncbi:MAG: transporter substrate-binding domain-containing protein [Clostridia bacterium]|nr:transporter substrate-binding domain-containing protein [Clostridia bacterium]
MKKLFAVLLALMLAAMAVTALAQADQPDLLARVREKGTLTIATEGAWSPWTYHDETGALTGFDIEIGALIAEKLGVEPDYKETDWGAILAGVDSGRFDMACNGVDYTDDRAEKYAFTDPYVYTEIVLVVRDDNEDIHTIDDLNGRTSANSPNSTYALRAEAVGASVIYVDTLGETMALVEQGRADASINAKGSVEDYLGEHPDAKIKIVQTMPGDPVCIPLRKNDDTATLVSAINEILAAAREDGTLAQLSEKYFGQDLTNPL